MAAADEFVAKVDRPSLTMLAVAGRSQLQFSELVNWATMARLQRVVVDFPLWGSWRQNTLSLLSRKLVSPSEHNLNFK